MSFVDALIILVLVLILIVIVYNLFAHGRRFSDISTAKTPPK